MDIFNKEMLTFLQKYLRINTMHPNPNYGQALQLFKQQAHKDGFLYKEIVLPSGNSVAIITYQGTDLHRPALALNHHMDIVPAPNSVEWITLPLEGEIQEGVIRGRGTQDMKGVGVAHYFALKQLKDAGVQPKRTIHIFIVPDEECGGFKGTHEFIQTDVFKQCNVGYLLDEGEASGDQNALFLKIGERKPLQIKIMSKGALAHGSQLLCYNAVHELITFLQQIVFLHGEQQKRAVAIQPGNLMSMNITSINAGVFNKETVALNVVSDCAQATIDIRVPPAMTLEQAKNIFEHALQRFPRLEYSVEATIVDYVSTPHQETCLYQALEAIIQKHGMIAKPLVGEYTTDIRYYHQLGIEGIGFTPFTSNNTMHATNESITIDELVKGKNILSDFLINFCTNLEDNND